MSSADQEIKSLGSDEGQNKALAPESSKKALSREEELREQSKKLVPPIEDRGMPLLSHLNELRAKLMRVFIVIVIGFFACYSVSTTLFEFLMIPLVEALPPNSKLIFTALPEAFFVYMKISLVAAIFLTSPFSFYQVWSFIAPGLYEEERQSAVPIALFSALFFIAGASFCFIMVFPIAFRFFMGFATDLIVPMPSLNEYLGFALKLLLAFGLVFEMPLFAYFLGAMGLITAEKMRKVRKYAILVIFIVAAILTPPDVFSQTLMALPMILLYEISIYVAAYTSKRKIKRDQKKAEKAKATEDAREAAAKQAEAMREAAAQAANDLSEATAKAENAKQEKQADEEKTSS